jgi:hypothetical protein
MPPGDFCTYPQFLAVSAHGGTAFSRTLPLKMPAWSCVQPAFAVLPWLRVRLEAIQHQNEIEHSSRRLPLFTHARHFHGSIN